MSFLSFKASSHSWSSAAVLKTADGATHPSVRIGHSLLMQDSRLRPVETFKVLLTAIDFLSYIVSPGLTLVC